MPEPLMPAQCIEEALWNNIPLLAMPPPKAEVTEILSGALSFNDLAEPPALLIGRGSNTEAANGRLLDRLSHARRRSVRTESETCLCGDVLSQPNRI
jgi:hypothetical protein